MVYGAYLSCWADVGANVVNGIVAIAIPTPAEIEMEEDLATAILIAIAHKAMSPFGSHAAIDYGVLQTQLGNETVCPPLVGISVVFEERPHVVVVVEVVFERIVNTGYSRTPNHTSGGTATGRITHVEADTNMVHQRGNGQLLLVGAAC